MVSINPLSEVAVVVWTYTTERKLGGPWSPRRPHFQGPVAGRHGTSPGEPQSEHRQTCRRWPCQSPRRSAWWCPHRSHPGASQRAAGQPHCQPAGGSGAERAACCRFSWLVSRFEDGHRSTATAIWVPPLLNKARRRNSFTVENAGPRVDHQFSEELAAHRAVDRERIPRSQMVGTGRCVGPGFRTNYYLAAYRQLSARGTRVWLDCGNKAILLGKLEKSRARMPVLLPAEIPTSKRSCCLVHLRG